MRILSIVFGLLFFAEVVAVTDSPAQAPASKPTPAPSSKPAQARSPQPYGNLLQVMRGILFPNSNILFDAQTNDPGVEKKPSDVAGGASSMYADIYKGWDRVEYAAVALAESANLITIPGRLCGNGKPVPVQRADWAKYVQGLVEVARKAQKAAQAKNRDAIIEVSGDLADACAACHEVYRDKPGGTTAARCLP